MESKNSEESGQIKGKDVDILLVITFEQSCLGCISELTYLKNYWCTVCQGSGVEPNIEPVKCKTCAGTGEKTNAMGTHSVKCSDCEGIGNQFYKCDGQAEFVVFDRIVIHESRGIKYKLYI